MSWKLGIGILLIILAMQAANAKSVSCHYKIMGVDFSTVTYGLNDDGTTADYVVVTVQGNSHNESFTQEPAAADELVHGWISKESSENSIEAIIYKERKQQGLSLMINPHIPMGNRMWAECEEAAP